MFDLYTFLETLKVMLTLKGIFILLSGTKVREMLSAGEAPPKEFSRPEVSKILMDYYQSIQ